MIFDLLFNKSSNLTSGMKMNISDITALEAWDILSREANYVLIDVRTEKEWATVGAPILKNPNNKLMFLSWRIGSDMTINPLFVKTLEEKVTDKNTPIIFLCRSGGRSNQAAHIALKAGFSRCYNICDGFEGSSFGPGWLSAKLPWEHYSHA